MLTAGNADGSNTFKLNVHGYGGIVKQIWNIPKGQFIAKIELFANKAQITWIRFTL